MKADDYDLVERTARFGEAVIDLCLTLETHPAVKPLVSQIVRSATSVGANYCEADDAETPRDFRHKIALCRKESRETMHWCRMLARACPDRKDAIRALWKEADELNRIFSAIFRKTTPASSA